MATATTTRILALWRKPIPQNIPFPVTELFQCLLLLNQYVCKNLWTTDIYLLIIPRRDLWPFLDDPVFRFPQVKLVCVYCENNESYEQDQIDFQDLYPRLRFCHERDLPKELAKPIIDNAVDPSRSIDRIAINYFASSVTQRVSTKRPATTSRRPSIQGNPTFASLRGFVVKNMESIDVRFKCPTCQLVLREPFQLINCGHRTCQACVKVENDEMSCSACFEISPRPNIRHDKGFQRELEQLLISCAICGFPEILKHYQEHLDHVHQEHVNTTETHRTNHSNVVALLRSIRIPSNTNQRRNPIAEAKHQIKTLSHAISLVNNDQQRIHDDLCSLQNRAQNISEEMTSLKSTVQYNAAIGRGIQLNTDLIGLEISSLKQKLEDTVVTTDDGTYLWKINFVTEKMANAASGRTKSIYSPIFHSSRYGYKMRMRLYLNGDGDVRGEYLSLFIVIMRGEYDAILTWPYSYKIRFELIDQSTVDHNQHNISAEFWPDTTSGCFQRPKLSMNEGYGIKKVVPLESLLNHLNLYIRDDVMFIRVQGDYLEERPASLVNTGTGATPNDF